MKSLRVWLLLLLAFALPFRGAMAAGVSFAPPAHGQVHGVPCAEDSGHRHSMHGHASGTAQDCGGKCSFCASCCAAAALPGAGAEMPMAPPAVAVFPEHGAPAAEFFSSGPERPPRST